MITEFQHFLKSSKIYKPEDITAVLEMATKNATIIKSNKKMRYYDIPCAFDIETSSFFDNGEKCAIMYEWTFGINGAVIIGRTWQEFVMMIETISERLQLCFDKHLIVYVHNLSYEFQFMRKWVEWDKVFSIANRKPIYAITESGIEFRCSYLLSGYSLAKLGDDLHTYKIRKLVGELDYSKIRHSSTPMTDNETAYCVNDVKVVMAYVAERIETDGGIDRIPLTKTGYVRGHCRNYCFYETDKSRKKSFKHLRYHELMQGMVITSVEEYKQLKRGFQGGFVHANPFYSGKTVNNAGSDDFTSSYPAQMLANPFPMSSAELIRITSKEQFEYNLKHYCCLFDIEIIGLESALYFENYISSSRCWGVKNAVINNGRIVSAEHLFTTVTEQDFMIIKKFYKWEQLKVGNFRRYRKGYLPTDFVKAILKLYQDKTTLKGVAGKEVEYLRSKEMLNSCYGMAVTDIIRQEYTYTNNEWGTAEPDYYDAITKYNNSWSRFLFYPWGVWVTAYARVALFSGIIAFGNDYVYSDTDSIKSINRDKHLDYINKYNERIRHQLYKAMDYHGIPRDAIEPKTIKGVHKCLGVWDFEGTYDRFKTLGAKRYMVEENGEINLTVAGLNKKVCVPYLKKKYKDKVFENFTDQLYVPPEYTGKNTHTYIDDERCGYVTDYQGNTAPYRELSSVHLMASDYSLSISHEYAEFILTIQNEII